MVIIEIMGRAHVILGVAVVPMFLDARGPDMLTMTESLQYLAVNGLLIKP
jgi:hypothetical protein